MKFQPDMPELTDSEIASVPGAKASLGRLDEVQWEVLERLNDKMVIKRDEEKFWSAQPGQIGEQFKNLKDQHAELLLRTQANTSVDDVEAAATPTGSRTGAETGGGGPSSSPALKELESVSKLDETHGIELKVSSEVANVELILCKDASVWVVAAQDKTLAKHVVLGGAGTGQWVPESEAENSIPFKLSDGDKTIVQLDEASFAQEASGISSLSIYKMLLRSEKDKGVVEHKISFLTVERLQNIDAGGDGFELKIKSPMVFNCVTSSDKVTSKNFFHRCLSSLKGSDGTEHLMVVYRFRFERVGQTFKIQRPYICTRHAMSLKKDLPVLVAKAS